MTGSNILIAYFSHSGNTLAVAEHIHDSTGGGLFRISTVAAYPSNYDAVVQAAKRELQNDSRPELFGELEKARSYETVFLGYPNWWGTMPMAVFSFLEAYDLAGKTIAPFCTHEGSGLGWSVRDLKTLCPKSTVLDGLAVRGGNAKGARSDVSAWIAAIGIE